MRLLRRKSPKCSSFVRTDDTLVATTVPTTADARIAAGSKQRRDADTNTNSTHHGTDQKAILQCIPGMPIALRARADKLADEHRWFSFPRRINPGYLSS